MNYNNYDDEDKKGFDFGDIINDKKQRSRFILFVYLIIFIVLIIFIRANMSNIASQEQEQEKIEGTNNEPVVNEEGTNSELDEMFSFIDMNNYDFDFNINSNNSSSIIVGKRFNNKFNFELKNNEDILYFNGTSNYIKAKESLDGESKVTGFPYVLINVFDTKTLKDLIEHSTINNDVYEITNEEIGKIVKENLENKELVNSIELIKSNNKVVQINLFLSNAISSYTKETSDVIITLKYSNFGLVDDFIIE